ncbi:unnamed protein product [Clonostachys rosea]|uniref:Uncharacterized protein n=1 Tax=Bionectria ochroleuca TaxID=29856 RepID=A0ABY6U4T9_BIOOC|nr:unnamed protein product [Clonostachys rosea]
MRHSTLISLALTSFSTVTNAFQAIGTDYSTVVSQKLFSDGKSLYLGDYTLLGSSEAAPVELDDSVATTWVATPVATDNTNPTWSGLYLAVPSSTEVGYSAVLLDPSADLSNYWHEFYVYNPYILVQTDSPGLQDYWYAVKSGIDGVWKLEWQSSSDDATRITLRKSS